MVGGRFMEGVWAADREGDEATDFSARLGMVTEDEGFEYLGAVNLIQVNRPGGDAECDAAVDAVTKGYRRSMSGPRYFTDKASRRACTVLGIYAARFMKLAAKGGVDGAWLDKALIVLHVSNLATIEMHEAAKILDRYILMIGAAKAEGILLEAAKRLDLAEELVDLMKRRVERVKN